jgi:chlorite dismutase
MNELFRFITVAVSPEWRRRTVAERDADKHDFARALETCGVAAHAYSLVGTRADADLLLWLVADDAADLRVAESRLAATTLWAWSTRPHAFLAARRKSKYLGEHEHAASEHRAPAGPVGDKAYVVVYPMTKKRSWYALPLQERGRIMAGHFAIGHKYPDIRIHTGYSFGIDDHEFVVAFEAPDPGDFLALVAELRETESSSYTERETPIFVGAGMGIGAALDLIDGAAATVTA